MIKLSCYLKHIKLLKKLYVGHRVQYKYIIVDIDWLW